jgi:alpha-D-ribose 1-methylphosphonate 5-triphosphate synthase subunit PhnG
MSNGTAPQGTDPAGEARHADTPPADTPPADTPPTDGPQADAGAEAARRTWMSVLAKAPAAELAAAWRALGALPAWQRVRPPEVGMVMARGRIGATGRRFNLGEVTVTRCTVRLDAAAGHAVGHAYVMGRDKTHAERAAVLDALLQHPDWHPSVHAAAIAPLQARAAERRAQAARKAGATKVDFTTITRGDG